MPTPPSSSPGRKRKSSDDGTAAPSVRRFRASRACQYCRTRKVRCDVLLRNDAGCTNCRLDGRECVLLESRRGRTECWLRCDAGLPQPVPAQTADLGSGGVPESAAASGDKLGETLSIAMESVPGGDVPVCVTFNGDHEDLDTKLAHAKADLSAAYTHSETLDVLTLSPHDSTSTTAANHHCSHHSPGSTAAAALPAFIEPFRSRIPAEDLEFLALKGALTVPEPDVRLEILKGYIFCVYPFMPMLDLKAVVDAVVHEQTDDRISLLLFQAIMFAGLSSLELPVLRRMGFETAKQAREVFFTRVKLLYEFDIEPDRAAVFQAMLLMSSWFSAWNEWRDTSYWTAQALLVAQNMGLHRQPTAACGSDHLQSLRRRMWWSLFIRDRMIALGTRRPMRVRDDGYDVAMLTLEDFSFEPLLALVDFDAEQQKATALMCIDLAKLCVTIGHVLSTQYTTLSTKPAVAHTTMVVPRRSGQRPHELHKLDAEIDDWLKQRMVPVDAGVGTFGGAGAAPGGAVSPLDGLSQQTTCADVHWAMLSLTHLTLVNVLHRTQALQPMPHTSEALSLRAASRRKVKDAACKVTKITQAMLHRHLVRFLGLNGITALLAACLSHMVDIRTGNDDVRDASIFRFDQSMQVLQAMRCMYATADAAVSFLAAVVRKVSLTLPSLVARPPAPYFSSSLQASSYPVDPWSASGPDWGSSFSDVPDQNQTARPVLPAKQPLGYEDPVPQILPVAQQQPLPPAAAAGPRPPDTTTPLATNKDGMRSQKNFRFDEILFDSVLNPVDEQPMDFEPILYNYEFFMDNFEFSAPSDG